MEGGEKKCLPNRLRDQSSFLIKLRADPQTAPKPQTPPEFASPAVCRELGGREGSNQVTPPFPSLQQQAGEQT